MSEKVLGLKEKDAFIRKCIAERKCVICGADISNRYYTALKCFKPKCTKTTIENFRKDVPVVSVEEVEQAISFVEHAKSKVWKCPEDADEFEDTLAFLRKRLCVMKKEANKK